MAHCHVVAIACAVAGTLAGGCVRVLPHQRATLARPDMELTQSPLADGEGHARAYREGSSGGAAGKAGGCGCN